MRKDIEKIIQEEVEELLTLKKIWQDINSYSHLIDTISERLRKLGFTEGEIKELRITIYTRLKGRLNE